MVLEALGARITSALGRLNQEVVIGNELLESISTEVREALIAADVPPTMAAKVAEKIRALDLEKAPPRINQRDYVRLTVIDELQRLVDPQAGVPPAERKPAWRPDPKKMNVIMFVGLQGAGKTTTCTKVAAYYARRQRLRTGIVCADTFRAGAVDQLKQNAAAARIPFYGSYTDRDPVRVAADGLEHFRKQRMQVVIVDTSGRHQQDQALFAEMQHIRDVLNPDQIIFVLDATNGQGVLQQARAFSARVNIGSIILTKLDSSARGGGALVAVAATHSPIVYVCTGEHLSDIEPFAARGFITRLLGMGDASRLFQRMAESTHLLKSTSVMEHLGEGRITFRDLSAFYDILDEMGSLQDLLKMMPGNMDDMLRAIGGYEHMEENVKRFRVVLRSMTADELDGHDKLDDSRRRRVARGSGVAVETVHLLEKQRTLLIKLIRKKKRGQPNPFQSMLRAIKTGSRQGLARASADMQQHLASVSPQLAGPSGAAISQMLKSAALPSPGIDMHAALSSLPPEFAQTGGGGLLGTRARLGAKTAALEAAAEAAEAAGDPGASSRLGKRARGQKRKQRRG